MANDTSSPGSGSAPMTWHQKELLGALKRLVTARERLAGLEGQVGEEPAGYFHPEDIARLEQLQIELDYARQKASSPFGRKWVDKLHALEINERLVLDRLGVATYDEYRAKAATRPSTPVEVADPMVIEFARRELGSAEQAFLELQMMDVPDAPAIDLTDESDGAQQSDGSVASSSDGSRTRPQSA